jgi:hypothetical protein
MRTYDYNQSVQTTNDDLSTTSNEQPCYGTQGDRRFFARAYAAMVGCYALMMAAYSVVFWQSSGTAFNLGVCFVYGAMYFGVPIVLARIAFRRDGRFRPKSEETRGLIRTNTGPLKPAVAFAQIVIIPAALALCTIALVTVYTVVTAGHQP